MSDPQPSVTLLDCQNICAESAGRLNVVLQMLQAHSDHQPARPWTPMDTGGYELSIMRDVLEAVRDNLWKIEKGGA